MMAHRTVVGVAIAAALLSILDPAMSASAWAQQLAKLPKVAILSPRAPTTQACGANMQGSPLPCFFDAMRELGYVDGKTVAFEIRYADDDYKKLPALAAELVRLGPDVVLTARTPAQPQPRTRRARSRSSSLRPERKHLRGLPVT